MPVKGPNVGFIRNEVSAKLPKWQKVDDCVEGEDKIKSRKEAYLPQPMAFSDATKNKEHYRKYLLRSVFYPVTGRTAEGLIGQVFSKEITTQLPASLGPMVEDVDGAGTTLEQQAKQSLSAVLKFGRAGLLSDFPTVEEGTTVTLADVQAGRIRPRVILYQPHQIINWREVVIGGESQLSLLVLAENKDVSVDEYEVTFEPRWRVIKLNESDQVEVSVWKLREDGNPDEIEYIEEVPATLVRGSNNSPISRIPFSFIGAVNNDSTIDESPLYPLAALNVAHFRNSADYEQSAFLVGQPTPVFTGLTDEWVKNHIAGKVTLGSSNAVSLPPNATATLLQPEPNSMPMEAMKHKEDQMKAIGAKLIEPNSTSRTATEAEIEETSEASVLSSVAKNVSAAYERAFFLCSSFMQQVEIEEIEIVLNSEFQVMGLNAQERQEVVAAWQAGILTWEEVRDVYRRKGIAFENDDDAKTKIENGLISFDGGGNLDASE